MKLQRPVKPFAEHPAASIVLALLLVCIGIAFVSGWIPDSPHRQHFPGHQWVMAGLCWSMALFLAACASLGCRCKPDNQG
jgi:hypothetical protein